MRCNTQDVLAPCCPQSWSCKPPTDKCPLCSQQSQRMAGPAVCWEGALAPATCPSCGSGGSGAAGAGMWAADGEVWGSRREAAQCQRCHHDRAALGPHSPGTDKGCRKRGDLSPGLAWLVSAPRGGQRSTRRAGATTAPVAQSHLIAACHGSCDSLSHAGKALTHRAPPSCSGPSPSVMATCSHVPG